MKSNLFTKSRVFLASVVVLAIVLRFWQLGAVPPSPDWDEASLGYNAYSIIETGRDEYGEFLPFVLRSFDDYKPALYAYFLIPFVKLFGLNIVSVRLPSAIFGVIAVITTYFLVKELFNGKYREQIALLSAFLLAISPWHLQFSRIAFETQVGLSLNLLSLLFFLKGLKKYVLFIPSAIFAAASIYMYQSEKVYLPILFAALILIYWKEIIKIPKKYLLSPVIIGLVLVSPMFSYLLTNQDALLRAKGVSVFSDQTQFLSRNVIKYADDVAANNLVGLVVDNRRIEYAKAVISGYIAHFDLNWLFIKGDIERHHAPFMGLLYLVELPLLFIGIYYLIFGNYSRKTKLTVFALFLIAPIPASVTSGVPHAVRTINFLPTFQIFIAIGLLVSAIYISNLKNQIAKIQIKYLIFALFVLFFIFNFLYYINQYFVQQNYYFSENWQYGYREAIDFVKPIQGSYKKIVVTNERPLDQSYMFFLFYLQYNPSSYLESGGTISGGFRETHKGFGNYTFRPINWEEDKNFENALFVGRPSDTLRNAKVLKTINYLNGEIAIVVFEN